MINQQTVQKLQEMRLNAMADSFKQQLSDKEFYNLSFDERFGLIIDYEWSRGSVSSFVYLRKLI